MSRNFYKSPGSKVPKWATRHLPAILEISLNTLADFNEASATLWHNDSVRPRRWCCCPGNWKWTAKDLAARAELGTTRAKNQRAGMAQSWKPKTAIGFKTHWDVARAQRLWGLKKSVAGKVKLRSLKQALHPHHCYCLDKPHRMCEYLFQ